VARSLFAGMSDYSHQSFDDMLSDLKTWVNNLKQTSNILKGNVEKLKELKYWDKIPIDFIILIQRSIKFYNTSIQEISEIVEEIQEEVRPDHVARIRRLYKVAIELDFDYGRIWHQKYNNKEYGNKDFKLVEELYGEGRQMAIDMKDLSNLAARLKDFIGKKTKPQQKAWYDIFELKPNILGLGINFNKLIEKFVKRKQKQ